MKRLLVLVVLVLVGAGGYWFGRSSRPDAVSTDRTPAAPPSAEIWTCSMHPQVRLDAPGNCPICEMPLVRTAGAGGGGDGRVPRHELSEHARAMASVETEPALRRALARELRAIGRIEYNETSLATITPRFDGYAARLFVNFTGVEIRAGDHLVEVYSPELLVAQQEFLIALQSGADSALVGVTTTKLRLLGLTDEQITKLTEQRETTDHVTLYSPISGTVIAKDIVQNQAFDAGDALYRIANLDSVWVYLEVYEYDLAWVRYGQRVRVSAQALPGRAFEGLVTFVQPLVDENTRTIRVPVHVENRDHALKPGMFVTAVIEARLTAEGVAAATGVEGRFTCPMHPQVLAAEAGECPLCQMALELVPGAGPAQGHLHEEPPATAAPAFACEMECEPGKIYAEPGRCPVCNMKLESVENTASTSGTEVLAVPVTAVLDSGTRRLVYVERERGVYEPRELTLGPRAGAWYAVLSGLAEGEHVVTRGGFLIDSQFQISGQASLFYPGGLHGDAGHAHAEER